MKIILIVLLLIIAVLGYDLWDEFYVWFSRIKVGRLPKEAWQKKTREVLGSWLRKGAPEVPIRENESVRFIKKINNYGKITSVTYWQDAALLKAASLTDVDFSAEVEGFVARYINPETGEWRIMPKKIDSSMFSFELLSSKYTDNEKIKPAMDFIANMLKSEAEKYGTVPYNNDVAECRFVDTTGMICPFLMKYAVTYGEDKYIELAMKQIREYREHGVNDKFKIPFHCFKKETFEPLGVCGWGRGCAWWAIGLTDSLQSLLEAEGHSEEKAELLKLTTELLDAAKKYIYEDGTVCRMLFNKSDQDSSACAMLAYCFACIGKLTANEEYKALAVKMREKLMSVTLRSGIVDFSQGDTHSIGFYSERLCIVPAAQGFAIAADEMIESF